MQALTEAGDLVGKTAVITGTRGIALGVAAGLLRRGVNVVLGGRDHVAGEVARKYLADLNGDAEARYERLDLGSIGSIEAFSQRVSNAFPTIDILINNAAVTTGAKRQTTMSGWETNIGVNYLGHFLLTGLLLPTLRRSIDPRIVSVSSILCRKASLKDLQSEIRYDPLTAHARSKLASLSFGVHLNAKSEAGAWSVGGYVAHPGIVPTSIMHGAFAGETAQRLIRIFSRAIGHGPSAGALSILDAAVNPLRRPGMVLGPRGFREFRGSPGESALGRSVPPEDEREQLWQASQAATGHPFP